MDKLTSLPSSLYVEATGTAISSTRLVDKLKECGHRKDLHGGRVLHSNAIEAGCHKNRYVATALITMYSKCGSMQEALNVFENIIARDVVSWNALILGYVENGECSVALDVFNSMECEPDRYTFVAALKACSKKNSLQKGMTIHAQARERGFDRDVHVGSTLVDMYSKCGDILRARDAFEKTMHRNVVTWTALILGYVENGECCLALDIFNSMDCAPNSVTFVAAIKACGALAYLQKGRSIHRQARESGFHKDVFVASTLVDMYGKLGDMLSARDVFDAMVHRNAVSWNVLILGYVENGESLIALDVFNSMDCAPNRDTFVAALKACTKLDKRSSLQRGLSIHEQARERGFGNDVFVTNTLVDMYSKCGEMLRARDTFDRTTQRDVVSWNTLIQGYVENGESLLALEVFNSMECAADRVTFVAALKACAGLACIHMGLSIHRRAIECGFDKDVFVANSLVDMYSKCRDMVKARDVFNRMMLRDVVSWTALILGYVGNGESLVALDMFDSMNCAPNRVTFIGAIKACACLAMEKKLDKRKCLHKGVAIHRQAREHGFEKDLFVASTLVDMYSKCGDMLQAKEVFDGMIHRDVVSWTALILGYAENGESSLAMHVFNSMDVAPDKLTYVAALKACAGACLENGLAIHMQARERGFDTDLLVANTLVCMYSKCGDMLGARDVFNGMTERDVVTWNALILGYVENGSFSTALNMFNSMDCAPDNVTFVAALKACARLGALQAGERIHDHICELGLEQDETVGSSLVDFYGKCGNVATAEDVFNRMCSKDIVSWTALIGGYALLGDMSRVFSLVEKMQDSDVRMEDVTMLLVLSACNHAGMVEEGVKYFESMSGYGITACVEHYTCMVDMLSRANRLEEALSLVERMPIEGDSQLWMTLLAACKKWSNVEIGTVAFQALVAWDDEEHVAAACVLMRSIYMRLGMQRESEEIEAEGKKASGWNKQGQSWWCDAHGEVIHRFVVGNSMELEVAQKLLYIYSTY